MTIALDEVPAAFHPHVAQIRHLLGCYLRYFVGRPRPACDRLHLREIVDRLAVLERETREVARIHDGVKTRLEVLRGELAQVEDALGRDHTPAERASYLAARANQQFLLWERLFTNRSRATRRAALGERLVANLAEIQAQMRAVDTKALPHSAQHETNLVLVTTELERIRGEIHTNAVERAKTTPEELVRMFGAAANQEIADYRKHAEGRERNAVDLDLLSGMCDRLGELGYQMATVPEIADDSVNRANLKLVARSLDQLETEFGAVAASKGRILTVAQFLETALSLRTQLLCADASDEDRARAVERLDALVADPLVRRLAGTTEPPLN